MARSALSDAAIVGIGRTPFVRKSGRTTLGHGQRSGTRRVARLRARTERRRRLHVLLHRRLGVADAGRARDRHRRPRLVPERDGRRQLGRVGGRRRGRRGRHRPGRRGRRVPRASGSGTRYGKAMDRVLAPGEGQFAAPHGYLVPPQWFAMWCRRHQHVYGSTSEDLGAIAVQQRAARGEQPARDRPRTRSPSTTTSKGDGSTSRSASSTAATRSTARSRSSSRRPSAPPTWRSRPSTRSTSPTRTVRVARSTSGTT